jgi:hypothetical protein
MSFPGKPVSTFPGHALKDARSMRPTGVIANIRELNCSVRVEIIEVLATLRRNTLAGRKTAG